MHKAIFSAAPFEWSRVKTNDRVKEVGLRKNGRNNEKQELKHEFVLAKKHLDQ